MQGMTAAIPHGIQLLRNSKNRETYIANSTAMNFSVLRSSPFKDKRIQEGRLFDKDIII